MKFSSAVLFPIFLVSTMTQALPVVKVNFVFATTTPQAQKYNNKETMLKQIQKLNAYFKTAHQQQIFQFKLNTFSDLDQTQQSKCNFFKLINRPATLDPYEAMNAFNQCFDKQKGTVHFVIFDGYSEQNKLNSISSWGFNNNNNPFVLIDWYQLKPSNSSTDAHEMGHAFGLTHVCDAGVQANENSNIMTSSRCSGGNSGKQNLGFNKKQLDTILKHYQKLGH